MSGPKGHRTGQPFIAETDRSRLSRLLVQGGAERRGAVNAAKAALNAVQTNLEPLTDRLMRSSKSRSRNKSNRQRSLGNIVNRVFDSSGPEGKVRGTPQQIIDKYLTLARDAQLSNDRVAEQSFLQHAEHYTRMLGEAQREMAERQQQQQHNNHNQRHGGNDERDGNGGRDNGQRDHGHQRRDQAEADGDDNSPAQAEAAAVTPEQPAEAPKTDEARPARRPRTRRAQGEGEVAETGEALPDAVTSAEAESGPVETPEGETVKAPARRSSPRVPRSPTGRSRRKPAAEGEAQDTAGEAPGKDAEQG